MIFLCIFLFHKLAAVEYFFEAHKVLIEASSDLINRELSTEIDWSDRLIGIKGFRGVGKTTFLLDYIRKNFGISRDCLYVNLNDFYFTKRRIFSFADEFYKRGGKVLVLDQIQKYEDWSKDLKECYTQLPDLKIVFACSPALPILEGDLANRAKVYHLEGLSFREFLNFKTGLHFEKYRLSDLLQSHIKIAPAISAKVRPLAYFSEYLQHGFYPYFMKNPEFYRENLLRHTNLALEVEVTYLNQLDLKYLSRLRKLLQLVGSQMPFSPNVSKISQEVDLSRTTILNYLHYLKNARLVSLFFDEATNSQLQKPDQVLLQNTNLLHVVAPENVNNRNLRLTFFSNQVAYSHAISTADEVDFIVDGNLKFMVGGKHTQPLDERSYAAADMIELGTGHVIPLWLFGFLY